jgi:ankyrin repeat protein
MNDLKNILTKRESISDSGFYKMCPLMEASRNEDINKVRMLLRGFLNAKDKKDENDSSSLCSACMNNHRDVARLLIEKFESPLMVACLNNQKEKVDLLVSNEPDLFLKNESEQTCLSLAYQNQDGNELVKYLIDIEPRLMNEDQEFLVEVVRRNDLEMLEYLIERNINLDVRERTLDMTPLIVAIKEEKLEMFHILLEKGANPDITDYYGSNAFMVALECDKPGIAKILIQNTKINSVDNDGNNELMIAANYCSDVEIFQMLLEKQAHINWQNNHGRTALMNAISTDNLKIAEILIENGADLEIKDKYMGQTALHYACLNGRIDLVYLMIKKGVDVNILNSRCETPLMNSLEHHRQNFVLSEMLIDYQADLTAIDCQGEDIWFKLCYFSSAQFNNKQLSDAARKRRNEAILWYFAVYKRDNEMINDFFKQNYLKKNQKKNFLEGLKIGKFFYEILNEKIDNLNHRFDKLLIESHKRCFMKLAENNNDFDLVNKFGQTRLMSAVLGQSDKWIIEFLINKGANISHLDHEKRTALHYALEHKIGDTAELLIKNGANINEQTTQPYLFFACNSKTVNSDAFKLLIENGINLHDKYKGKSIFGQLCESVLSSSDVYFQTRNNFNRGNSFTSIMNSILPLNSLNIIVYRNALIKELSDIFKYSDKNEFRKNVVKLLDNEEIKIVQYDHLKALLLLFRNEMKDELEKVIEHLKSNQFRERFFFDYMKILIDQKELLKKRFQGLSNNFLDLIHLLLQQTFIQADCTLTEKDFFFKPNIKFEELLSEEKFDHILEFIRTKRKKSNELKNLLKCINAYIDIIEDKLYTGRNILKFIEIKL